MKTNQRDRVLKWLRTKGELTTYQAVTELGIMSLPRRIMELKRAGHDIETIYRTSSNGVRYGVYRLATH